MPENDSVTLIRWLQVWCSGNMLDLINVVTLR